jgi:hypothetical protein
MERAFIYRDPGGVLYLAEVSKTIDRGGYSASQIQGPFLKDN